MSVSWGLFMCDSAATSQVNHQHQPQDRQKWALGNERQSWEKLR